jgi:hypothetical protein
MKPTASIYLHCDPTASHCLKLLMDAVFGPHNLRNEIIWSYRRWTASRKSLPHLHDAILFYTQSEDHFFQPPMMPNDKPNPSQYVSAKDASGKTVVLRAATLVRVRLQRHQARVVEIQLGHLVHGEQGTPPTTYFADGVPTRATYAIGVDLAADAEVVSSHDW